jgi:hypothetical protein
MSGMPAVPQVVEKVGPSADLDELIMEVNDKLEDLARVVVNGVQFCETTQGWIALVWYKIISK